MGKDYTVTIPAEVVAAAAEENQDISFKLHAEVSSK